MLLKANIHVGIVICRSHLCYSRSLGLPTQQYMLSKMKDLLCCGHGGFSRNDWKCVKSAVDYDPL